MGGAQEKKRWLGEKLIKFLLKANQNGEGLNSS